MIKVARDIKIDELVILGDYGDIYSLHQHGGKDPTLVNTLTQEIEEINKHLDEIDINFPTAKKIYIEGNHEYRLERYILNKCPEFFGVTEYKLLTKMDRRYNWTFIPYGPNQRHNILGSKLIARHEPLGNNAKNTASKALCSLVYGHIHRIEESHLVGLTGENHVCFSVGWLGDKTMDKVYGYVKGHHQWQLGFGIVYADEKTGNFYHHKIHIQDDYTCIFNGKIYKG